MLCIPTLVALAEGDPELTRARAMLRARINAAADEARVETHYLASTPFREDDGRIVYVHVFRAQIRETMHAVGIPATLGWWPVSEQSLAPRRTAPRARLRLVS